MNEFQQHTQQSVTPYRTYLFGIDGSEMVAETIEELEERLASGKWFRTIDEAKQAIEKKQAEVAKEVKKVKKKLDEHDKEAEEV